MTKNGNHDQLTRQKVSTILNNDNAKGELGYNLG